MESINVMLGKQYPCSELLRRLTKPAGAFGAGRFLFSIPIFKHYDMIHLSRH